MEPSMCGGDAAFCEITLTTYLSLITVLISFAILIVNEDFSHFVVRVMLVVFATSSRSCRWLCERFVFHIDNINKPCFRLRIDAN